MENWTEIKTAYLLGQLGTVSATAETIGVHRATVIRRVESLEGQLGGKLFQRHTKGYTPTDLGHELIRVAERSEEHFKQLMVKARTQDEELAGQFIVSCPEFIDHVALSAIKAYKSANPKMCVHYRSSNEVMKLEHGEADVSIVVGDPPEHPDYVVRPLMEMPVAVYCCGRGMCSESNSIAEPQRSRLGPFVVSEKNLYGEAVGNWINENIEDDQIIMTASTIRGANDAVFSGLGAGFLPIYLAHGVNSLCQLIPTMPDWNVPVWVATHVDLHRCAKVQNFLKVTKGISQPEMNAPSHLGLPV
ncbi:MAG: LysR family transcriptional regulator [Pseudomonadota bacterium]